MLRFLLFIFTIVSLHAQNNFNAYDVVVKLSEEKITYAKSDNSEYFFKQPKIQNYINMFLNLKTASYEDYSQRSKVSIYKDQFYGIKQTSMLLDYAESISDKEPEKMADIYISLLRYAKNSESNAYGMLDFFFSLSVYNKLLSSIKITLIDENISLDIRETLKHEIQKYAPTSSIAINRVLSQEAEYFSEKITQGMIVNSSTLEQYFMNHYKHAITKAIEDEYSIIKEAISHDSLEELNQYDALNDQFANRAPYYFFTSIYASVVGSVAELLHLEKYVTVKLYTFENLFAKIIASTSVPKVDDIWLDHKKLIVDYRKLYNNAR